MARDELEDGTLYAFEQSSKDLSLPQATRSRSDAAVSLQALRSRLGIREDVLLDHDVEKLLLRYCSDTILNILWYDRARNREQRSNTQRTYLMVVLMAVALLLVVASAFAPVEGITTSASTVLPFCVLAGGALTVMQVIATLGDGKARLAIFWKAGADLKEALYNFEHKWHGKVLQGDPPCVTDEFKDAVYEELRLARAVTRAERIEFFANLRSPLDVVAVATSTVNGLQARRTEGNTAMAARNDRIAAARKAASEARAAVLASEFRLAAASDPAVKAAEQTALVAARAEVVRTEAIVQDLLGG